MEMILFVRLQQQLDAFDPGVLSFLCDVVLAVDPEEQLDKVAKDKIRNVFFFYTRVSRTDTHINLSILYLVEVIV